MYPRYITENGKQIVTYTDRKQWYLLHIWPSNGVSYLICRLKSVHCLLCVCCMCVFVVCVCLLYVCVCCLCVFLEMLINNQNLSNKHIYNRSHLLLCQTQISFGL